jgi:hypothetical protein
MSFDEGLAQRICEQFLDQANVEEKKMFGRLCFMVSNHMCCGIVNETLMARVGAERYQECLARKHAGEMDFTGRAMKGFVYVAPAGVESDQDLAQWLAICCEFVKPLPPKKPR